MATVATVRSAKGDLYPVGSSPIHADLNSTAKVGWIA